MDEQAGVDFSALIAEAFAYARPIRTSENCEAGGVAALIVANSRHKYTGVCVDFACSVGFCAEHAAVAEMLKAHESHIRLVVSVLWSGEVIPPCGRCREMMWQLDARNRDSTVVLGTDRAAKLSELLPYPWTMKARGERPKVKMEVPMVNSKGTLPKRPLKKMSPPRHPGPPPRKKST